MTDTLKSICEQCNHLHSPQLEFLPERFAREKEIIVRDLAELVSAASMEKEKSVILLAGTIFEAVLFCFIQAQSDFISARRGYLFAFNPEQSLGNYVSIFNRYFSTLFAIPDLIAGYRDIIHINRELQHAPNICRSAAPEMLRLLNALLEKLHDYSSD
jgi:hypothetical protein